MAGRADSLPQRSASLTDQVMEYVRRSVISRRMEPGALYSVYQLADELEVSRSPVRDALLRLEEAGLVKFERNRGFRILPTRPEDVAEIFTLRLSIEVPTARRAAANTDEKFQSMLRQSEELTKKYAANGLEQEFFDADQDLHDLIMEAGGSTRGRTFINRLRVSTRLLGASTAGDTRTLGDIIDEHEPILQAIYAADSQRAGEAMAEHLRSTGRLLIQQTCRRQDDPRDPLKLWDSLTEGY